MNRDDVIRMAREAGMSPVEITSDKPVLYPVPDAIQRFAALVATAEREKCVKYLESCEDGVWANTCAYAIRAMGKK